MSGGNDAWARYDAHRNPGTNQDANKNPSANQRPDHYDIGSAASGGSGGPGHAGNPNSGYGGDTSKLSLDKKLAIIEKHTYNEKDVHTWAKSVCNYFIGQNRCMMKFLKWIEDHGKNDISIDAVVRLNVDRDIEACDLEYVRASEAMWSWLNLAIGDKSTQKSLFDSVEDLDADPLCTLQSSSSSPMW